MCPTYIKSVLEKSDLFYFSYLLRGHVERQRPHVHLLIGVDARDDEEDPGTAGTARQETAETEDDYALVLLDHLENWLVRRLLECPAVAICGLPSSLTFTAKHNENGMVTKTSTMEKKVIR